MDLWTRLLTHDDGRRAWRRTVHGLWIGLRLIAVLYLGQAGAKFFYQGF